MLFDDNNTGGGKGRKPGPSTPEGMWSPEEEPHATERMSASPMPCNKECDDSCFANGEGCTWCDYTPA